MNYSRNLKILLFSGIRIIKYSVSGMVAKFYCFCYIMIIEKVNMLGQIKGKSSIFLLLITTVTTDMYLLNA